MHEIGPESGRLVVKTGRTGLGAKAGHDLTIEATRWRGTADPAGSTVDVEVDVASLEVREGTGGVKPLTDSDRAEIKDTFTRKILRAAEHPTISFRSTRVTGTPESFTVDGDLTIMGVTQPVTLHGQISYGQATGSATVQQTRWGIKPHTAFFGALKLRDEVEVEFDVALP
jgi:polyisoprenoid-binding protein YceI